MGNPHLRANSTDHVAYLQGWNAGIDRSWQIELERWRAEGRTAEHLGQDGVEWDRFARRAQLEDTARKCFEKLDGETQLWCRRYVDGINDALAAGHRSGREFELTETAPSPWNPWTPLGVFLVQHILFSTFPNKLFRAHVARSLGTTAVELFSIEAPVWSGSNAWAVHGSCTATGSPLIAGDPHRLLELPGTYQQVRLSCPEFDVVGFAFPGVPGLPHFGHTGNAAWAITNAMADYQDLYEEDLRRSGSDVLARGEHGWEAADVRWETIRIREGGTEEIEVIETRRGLIIEGGPAPLESPLVEEESDGGAVPWKPPLALRFPARVERRLGFEALLPLMRSRNVDDVEQALGRWVEPVNSVVAADRQGAVRHFLAGLVPRRHPDNRKLPVPAWSPKHQWSDGFIPLPPD